MFGTFAKTSPYFTVVDSTGSLLSFIQRWLKSICAVIHGLWASVFFNKSLNSNLSLQINMLSHCLHWNI